MKHKEGHDMDDGTKRQAEEFLVAQIASDHLDGHWDGAADTLDKAIAKAVEIARKIVVAARAVDLDERRAG
jgi:hypothetical protein